LSGESILERKGRQIRRQRATEAGKAEKIAGDIRSTSQEKRVHFLREGVGQGKKAGE